MTSDQLKKYVEKIELKERRYNEDNAYFRGANPPIFQPLPRSAPDNRIPIPYGTKALQQYGGYMGKVGTITYSGDYYESTLKPIFDFNDEALTTYSELQEAMKHGCVYELIWLDKDGTEVHFHDIPFDQGLPIYSDDLKKRLIGFIWERDLEDETCVATYWDEFNQQDWTKTENGKEWVPGPIVPHAGQGIVPVNIGQINKDKSNLIEHVKPLIDFVDQLFSGDVANESQRYANAMLLLADRIDQITTDESGRTMVDRLKEMNVMDGLGDDPSKKVQYVVRNIPTDFISFAYQTADTLIHKMIPILDAEDDKAGDTSGVALQWKTWPFELRCADIEAWFSRFLQNRIYIIAKMLGTIGKGSEAYKVDIRFVRNLPRNVTEMVDNFTKVAPGSLSWETALKLLPSDLVGGLKEEMKRIKANEPEDTMPDDEDPVTDDAI